MKIGRTASQIRTDARAKVRAATSSKSKEDRIPKMVIKSGERFISLLSVNNLFEA